MQFILQTQQYIAVVITLHNVMLFKGIEKIKESKYVFIEFVILTFSSGSNF